MARSIRIEYAGAIYHVMARGNRREDIYLDDDDRRFFLGTLSEACGMTGWLVHGWVLMRNHYHLCIETPEANLVAGMQWLQNTVTRRFNVRHRKWGRLFGDRYKAVPVEGGSGYGRALLDYIHLNPVRAGIISAGRRESVMDYPWSSVAGGYALAPEKRAKWFCAEKGLAELGLPDTAEGRRLYIAHLDKRAVAEGMKEAGVPATQEETDRRCSHLRRGWYWGSQAFAEKLMAVLGKKVGKESAQTHKRAMANRAYGEKAADLLIVAGLEAGGLSLEELKMLTGGDARKAAIAELLWKRTTVSRGWIAEKLSMKSAANVGAAIRRLRGGELKRNYSREFEEFINHANETN